MAYPFRLWPSLYIGTSPEIICLHDLVMQLILGEARTNVNFFICFVSIGQ